MDYAFQDINDIPGTLPEGRTKPWGTGQAVLAAKNVIDTPFIVINADDYYGKEGFKAVHEYLVNGGKSCMAGFVLKNTLSDNGGVTRGMMVPFSAVVMWTFGEKIGNGWKKILWQSGKAAFIFSIGISNIRGHLNAPNNFTNLNFDDQVLFSRAARTICDRIYKDSKYDWNVVLENYRTKINSFILSNDSEEKKKATEDMNLSWEGW